MTVKFTLDFWPMLLMVFSLLTGMVGLWTVDIGVSAQNIGNAVATNGWWVRDGIQTYHLGLYLTVLSLFLLSVAVVISSTIRRKAEVLV